MKTEKAGLPGDKIGLAKNFTVSQHSGRAFTNAFATFLGAAGGFTNAFATFSGAAGRLTNVFATFPARLGSLQTPLQSPQRSRLARKMGLSGSAGMRANLFFKE